MPAKRPYILTIAGFDPSSGAGLTADIKTAEQHQVYGLGVCTGITLQTEDEFIDIRWEKIEDVIKATDLLLKKYPVSIIKTGIMPSLDFLNTIILFVKRHYPAIRIIVDPVFSSSTGFNFYKENNKEFFLELLKNCYLITPNIHEASVITNNANAFEGAKEIANSCNVLLKGGHNLEKPGTDYLFYDNTVVELHSTQNQLYPKHGSGCVLSASIASNLALGLSLEESCKHSKLYIETILSSNPSLLAYHNVS